MHQMGANIKLTAQTPWLAHHLHFVGSRIYCSCDQACNLLLHSIDSTFVIDASQVGVDVNLTYQTPRLAHQLQFVAGLMVFVQH